MECKGAAGGGPKPTPARLRLQTLGRASACSSFETCARTCALAEIAHARSLRSEQAIELTNRTRRVAGDQTSVLRMRALRRSIPTTVTTTMMICAAVSAYWKAADAFVERLADAAGADDAERRRRADVGLEPVERERAPQRQDLRHHAEHHLLQRGARRSRGCLRPVADRSPRPLRRTASRTPRGCE